MPGVATSPTDEGVAGSAAGGFEVLPDDGEWCSVLESSVRVSGER